MVVDQYRQRYGEDRNRHEHLSSVRFREGVLDPESWKVLGMIVRPEAEQIHVAACRKAEARLVLHDLTRRHAVIAASSNVWDDV